MNVYNFVIMNFVLNIHDKSLFKIIESKNVKMLKRKQSQIKAGQKRIKRNN